MKYRLHRIFSAALAALLLMAPALAQESKSTDTKASDAAKPVVAVFRLFGSLTETPTDDGFPFSTEHKHALKDLTDRKKKAGQDKNVKAVIVTVSDLSLGFAQIEELRQALADLRSA